MNETTLQSKKDLVSSIVDATKNAQSLTVVEYRGLSVAQLSNLRRLLSDANSSITVYKNSLVERAFVELGSEDMKEFLVGPNAFVFCDDLSSAPKALIKFAKKNKALKIKAAYAEGRVFDANGVKELATLSDKDGMLSMFLSCLKAPMTKLAATLLAVSEAK